MQTKKPSAGASTRGALPYFRQLSALALVLVWLLTGCETLNQDRLETFTADGVFLFGRGDYHGAQESFQVALQLKPDDAGLLYNIGQCHDRLGDYAKAEHFYRQCLQHAPNHAESRYALAVTLYRTGRRTEANQMIQDWLTQQPELADPYALDGWRLRQEGAFPQAQGRLQQALGLDPLNSRALNELAILYEFIHMPDRALVLYERSLQQDPRQPTVVERINYLRAKGVKAPLPD